jgi:purine-nucleoside phosphorylase
MKDLYEEIEVAAGVLRKCMEAPPKVGIILGTGLGGLVSQVENARAVSYEELPHFPLSTSIGHAGRIVSGRLAGLPVAVMEGRFHAYEGYSQRAITFPVRVLKAVGAEVLIVTNACGGMNPQYACGDLMVIDDHINLMNGNPLIGINDERLGPRFPDMSQPYDRMLIDETLAIARREDIVVHRGVYVAVTGPNLETRAEYRFLRMIGADVVGMSTVPETLVAAHCGLRVLGLSVITDMCFPESLQPADIQDILRNAASAEPKLIKIVRGIVSWLGSQAVGR